MELYLAGAEQPLAMRQLDSLKVERIAISFFEWRRRHSTDDLYRHVPAGMKVIVTPGVAKKEAIDWDAFATDYLEFAERNADQALIYDMDAPLCPAELRREVRDQLSILSNVVMFPMEHEDLYTLASQYERIGINSRTAKATDVNDLRRLPASLYGSNITDPRVLRVGRFVATTSFAWLSGRRYGELWVFARNKLYHYAAENLAKAVRAHTGDIQALGIDPVACAGNDRDALTALAVRSLLAMAESLSKRPRDRREVEIVTTTPDGPGDELVAPGTTGPAALVSGNGARLNHERERVMLPVISINAQDDPPKMTVSGASLRQCDACYLSGSCPKFEAEASCAFMFPVEIRTDAQWEQASQVLLEFQFERISFGRFAEQVEGSGLSPRVGQEMDRFFKMLESVKGLKTPVPDPGAGVLSRIFGSPELEEGDEDDGQEEADYVEGEVVDEEEWGEGERSRVGAPDYEEGDDPQDGA